MRSIGSALFIFFVAALVIGNVIAIITWIAGGSSGALLTDIVIGADIVIVVGGLAAGIAFAAVFIYAMSKDAS